METAGRRTVETHGVRLINRNKTYDLRLYNKKETHGNRVETCGNRKEMHGNRVETHAVRLYGAIPIFHP